jgi:hypothetical protein
MLTERARVIVLLIIHVDFDVYLIAMIPLWMFPVAIACGNTYILKPSERVPGATMYMMELVKQAGIPAGVVNVIHGGHVRFFNGEEGQGVFVVVVVVSFVLLY